MVQLNKVAGNVKDTNLMDILPFGFAICHAGMSKEDRGLVEELFSGQSIQALVCTATLTWGVNLPASKDRRSKTLKRDDRSSHLPKMFSTCWGVLVVHNMTHLERASSQTTRSCNMYYLGLLNQQLLIESQFVSKLVDNLNAEIVLGDEAAQ
jgi:pre-mRNA-splicing helicase BRR2